MNFEHAPFPPARNAPPQSLTFTLVESDNQGSLSLLPRGGGDGPPERGIEHALALESPPAVSEPMELLEPVARSLDTLPDPSDLSPRPQPSVSSALGGTGSGVGTGSGAGHGTARGTGRAMIRGVAGMNPGLDLSELEPLHEEIPSYPLLAEWAGIQGDVVVRVTINEKGIPVRTELLEGPQALQATTLRAVKLWRFGRGMFRGRKVEATFDMTFRFILVRAGTR